MARSRFVQRSFRAPRRGTIWGRSPADTTITGLAAGTAVLDSTSVPVAEGETIVRTRGQIIVGTDQGGAGEDWVGAVGFAIASNQAVAVGVGSLPTPYTDQDSDLWFVHQFFGGNFAFGDATGFSPQGLSVFPFDSKAMRKFASGETLIVVVENGHATSGLAYFLQYSVLFKVA